MERNDGFRIVAHAVMNQHELLNARYGLKVETEASWISDNSPYYTTLDALVRIAQEYLGAKPEFERWNDAVLALKGGHGSGLPRPSNDQIEKGRVALTEYFDALAKLTSHKSMLVRFRTDGLNGEDHCNLGKSPPELRQSRPKHPCARDDNILFRPISQVALARAIAELQKRNGLGLKEAINCLFAKERRGGLCLRSKMAPWFGILCDTVHGEVRRQKRFEDLCVEMMVYLLGGGFADDEARREKLRDDFFEARRGPTDGNEPMAYDLSGRLKIREEFRLPDPWDPDP